MCCLYRNPTYEILAWRKVNANLQMLPLSLKRSDGCSRTDGDVGCFQELLMAHYDPK